MLDEKIIEFLDEKKNKFLAKKLKNVSSSEKSTFLELHLKIGCLMLLIQPENCHFLLTLRSSLIRMQNLAALLPMQNAVKMACCAQEIWRLSEMRLELERHRLSESF